MKDIFGRLSSMRKMTTARLIPRKKSFTDVQHEKAFDCAVSSVDMTLRTRAASGRSSLEARDIQRMIEMCSGENTYDDTPAVLPEEVVLGVKKRWHSGVDLEYDGGDILFR